MGRAGSKVNSFALTVKRQLPQTRYKTIIYALKPVWQAFAPLAGKRASIYCDAIQRQVVEGLDRGTFWERLRRR